MAGSYAYIADDLAGLRIIDISNPSNPFEVGNYDTPGYAHGVAVADSYAYVADGEAGLRVVDISNPSNPVGVGSYNTPGVALNVTVAGSYAYVADNGLGFCVIDISNPSNPIEVGYYDTPGSDECIAVAGPYVYVAAKTAGLQIYENLLLGIDESPNKIILPIRLLQNPVSGNYIELELSIKQRDGWEIGLYNLLGQKVKTFPIRGLSPGKYRIRLETRGLIGGVYFLRLQGKENQQSIRLTIIK